MQNDIVFRGSLGAAPFRKEIHWMFDQLGLWVPVDCLKLSLKFHKGFINEEVQVGTCIWIWDIYFHPLRDGKK